MIQKRLKKQRQTARSAAVNDEGESVIAKELKYKEIEVEIKKDFD